MRASATTFSTATWLATFFMMIASVPAFGGDGVLEIDQACALATGCFDGDKALFPVSITQPGSYILTGNLTVPDATTMPSRSRPAMSISTSTASRSPGQTPARARRRTSPAPRREEDLGSPPVAIA